MILSKRERFILMAVVAALAILAIDRLALTPLLDRRSALNDSVKRLSVDLAADRALADDRDRLNRRWQEVLSSGLHPDAQSAEGEILAALRSWARESRLTLDNFAPGRGERVEVNEKGEKLDSSRQFNRLVLTASGTGSMNAVREFLWRIQNSRIPVRVTELSLQSRREGTDDLAIQLGVSTLYLPPEPGPRNESQRMDGTRGATTRPDSVASLRGGRE